MQKTILSILWNKFLETLDQATWDDIVITVAKFVSWTIISAALINIPETTEKLAMALKYGNFSIIKIIAVFLLVFYWKGIYNVFKLLRKWYANLWSSMQTYGAQTYGLIYMGVPVIELVDYIITSPSYSRSDFCERFAVPRSMFENLFTSFDKIGVTIRGSNNARELSPEYSRADISSIITRACESSEIRPLIRKTETGYTHSPSM